jgi:hypothetical protein
MKLPKISNEVSKMFLTGARCIHQSNLNGFYCVFAALLLPSMMAVSCKTRTFNQLKSAQDPQKSSNLALENILPPTGRFYLKDLENVQIEEIKNADSKEFQLFEIKKLTKLGEVRLWSTNATEVLAPNTPNSVNLAKEKLVEVLTKALNYDLKSLKLQSKAEYNSLRAQSIDSAVKANQKDSKGDLISKLSFAHYIYESSSWPKEDLKQSTESGDLNEVFRFSWENPNFYGFSMPESTVAAPKNAALRSVSIRVIDANPKTVRLGIDVGSQNNPLVGHLGAEKIGPALIETIQTWQNPPTLGEVKSNYAQVLEKISSNSKDQTNSMKTTWFSDCMMNLKITFAEIGKINLKSTSQPELSAQDPTKLAAQALLETTIKASAYDVSFEAALFWDRPLEGIAFPTRCNVPLLTEYILRKSLDYHSLLPKDKTLLERHKNSRETLAKHELVELAKSIKIIAPTLAALLSTSFAKVGRTSLPYGLKSILWKNDVYAGNLAQSEFFIDADWDNARKVWQVSDNSRVLPNSEGTFRLETDLAPEIDVDVSLLDSFKITSLLLK